jgi:hypothetical protein
MNPQMLKKNLKDTTVILKCECGCSMFVVEKSEWGEGGINYNISVQDSRYDHNYNTLWSRLYSAMQILFGKPIYYNDVNISKPEIFVNFVKQLNELCQDQDKT